VVFGFGRGLIVFSHPLFPLIPPFLLFLPHKGITFSGFPFPPICSHVPRATDEGFFCSSRQFPLVCSFTSADLTGFRFPLSGHSLPFFGPGRRQLPLSFSYFIRCFFSMFFLLWFQSSQNRTFVVLPLPENIFFFCSPHGYFFVLISVLYPNHHGRRVFEQFFPSLPPLTCLSVQSLVPFQVFMVPPPPSPVPPSPTTVLYAQHVLLLSGPLWLQPPFLLFSQCFICFHCGGPGFFTQCN